MPKVLITDGCPGCETFKKKHREEIESGKFELIDARTPEGRRLIDKYDVRVVPCVIEDE